MTYPLPFPSLSAPLQLLVVDDQAFDREIILARLQEVVSADTVMREAEGGAAALRVLKDLSVPIDCVLLDLNLGDMAGEEVVRAAMELRPGLTIIMITVEADMNRALQCLQAGAEDFVIKGEYSNFGLYRTIRYALERRRSALENRRLNEALTNERALSAAQKEFIHFVSHEFRTPMAIISGAVQMLAVKAPELAKGAGLRQFNNIHGALSRLGLLLDDVIRLSKREDGKDAFESSTFDFVTLIQKVAEGFDEGRLVFELPAAQTYVGDVRYAEYALHNLISNGLKYSPPESKVTVRLGKQEGQIVIEVQDHGAGMSSEMLGRAGEKFYRAPDTAHIEGTGLGLYLTKRFMEHHQGSLSFESVPGEGTTARLVFPVR